MAELFADVPEALANSVEIAKRCNLTVELGKSKLPLFPIPEGMTENDYLVMRAEEGLAVRMKELYPEIMWGQTRHRPLIHSPNQEKFQAVK